MNTYFIRDGFTLPTLVGELDDFLLDAESEFDEDGSDRDTEYEPEAWELPYLRRGMSPPTNYGAGEV